MMRDQFSRPQRKCFRVRQSVRHLCDVQATRLINQALCFHWNFLRGLHRVRYIFCIAIVDRPAFSQRAQHDVDDGKLQRFALLLHAIKCVASQLRTVAAEHQLSGHAQSFSDLLHAAFKQCINVKRQRNFSHIARLAFAAKARCSRNAAGFRQARHGVNDVFSQTVTKRLVIGFPVKFASANTAMRGSGGRPVGVARRIIGT